MKAAAFDMSKKEEKRGRKSEKEKEKTFYRVFLLTNL
jgi:hypothetical protein